MGTLAVDIDGFRVRLATLRGARVRALPGALGDSELAISRRDGEYVFGAPALKRMMSHPLETADGLGALIGASVEEMELVNGWRGKPGGENMLVLGTAKIKLNKAVARALGELVDPALMLMGGELDRLVLTIADADARRDAWEPILTEVLAGVDDVHVEICDRYVAALYAARKAHGVTHACVVHVGRLGIDARLAERVHDRWETRVLERDACEGLLAVELRMIDALRAEGGVPDMVEATAMLREAARVLHRDLSGLPRDERTASGARIVPEAEYPLPYVALGGTSPGNLRLSASQLDRAYDELIRKLRKMCVRLAQETPSPEVVVLFGPGAAQADVRRTVEEVFDAPTHVLRSEVVMGGPLVPTTRKDADRRESLPARAAPPRVRFAAVEEEEEKVEIDASQASLPPGRKSSPGMNRPPMSDAAPKTPSRPPRASSETIPPSSRLELPAEGAIRNPETPGQLVALDLASLEEPTSVAQLLFAVARARFTGFVHVDLDGFENATLTYREGRPEWMPRERTIVIESLKSPGGHFTIETIPVEEDRSRTRESTHALVTDAVRKLVWTFEEREFVDAFAKRMEHAPRVTVHDETLLLRRGFRKPEVRFALNACTGSEPLEVILTRVGLGPRGMLHVIATLQLFDAIEWVA